jgi:NAD(P)-dependent dehydrogenase (short-subunit alcohol dehydrogenase family)
MNRLADRVVLVTGGAQGIGLEIARRLAGEGARVVVADINASVLDIGSRIEGPDPAAVTGLQLDVTSEASWASAIQQVETIHSRLDVLVNNAGTIVTKPIEQTSLAEWRHQNAVNLDGAFLGIKAALDLMRRSARTTPHGGSIVNMSSIAGLVGAPLMPGYAASKGALRLLTKSLAVDFGRRGFAIRVNSTVRDGCRALSIARAGCWSSGSIRRARTRSLCFSRTRRSCSFVRRAGALRSQPRRE